MEHSQADRNHKIFNENRWLPKKKPFTNFRNSPLFSFAFYSFTLNASIYWSNLEAGVDVIRMAGALCVCVCARFHRKHSHCNPVQCLFYIFWRRWCAQQNQNMLVLDIRHANTFRTHFHMHFCCCAKSKFNFPSATVHTN